MKRRDTFYLWVGLHVQTVSIEVVSETVGFGGKTKERRYRGWSEDGS